LQDSLIAIGSELVPIALEELVLELNPMKTDCMQEALQQVHAHKHSEGDGPQRHPGGNTHYDCAEHRFLRESAGKEEVQEGLS